MLPSLLLAFTMSLLTCVVARGASADPGADPPGSPLAPRIAGEETVTFLVSVPASTPADAQFYLSGNHTSVGPWQPAGHPLTRTDDGTWQAELSLPVGWELEYKFTRGSWPTVEKTADGTDLPNRTAEVTPGLVLRDTVAAWGSADAPAPRPVQLPHTRTGDFAFFPDFPSQVLGNSRQVTVYLPPQYRTQPDRRFPVFYLTDGQNLFDRATSAFGIEWQADETAQKLIASGQIEPVILVGIFTEAQRTDELTDSYSEPYGAGGKAPLFARFLTEELKPFIDRKFRTQPDREHTAIGGSSLGGLNALWLCETHPEIFGKCAAISPAIQWNDGALLNRWTDQPDAAPTQARIWLDVGTEESVRSLPDYVSSVQGLGDLLGTRKCDYRLFVHEGAHHNETAWQERFPQVLTFLFPAPVTPDPQTTSPQ